MPDNRFALYTVRDTGVTAYEAKTAMASVALSSTPLVTSKDLVSYHWSTHTFTGTAALDSTIRAIGVMPARPYGLPFVIIAGSERVYAGAFWYPQSDARPPVPTINPTLFSAPYQIVKSPVDTLDVRNDERVREALSSAGVLLP